jgi:carboxylesterase
VFRMQHRTAPSDSHVLPPARSFFFEGTNDTALVLIHGFTGISSDMLPVAERLHSEGYTVSVPRLPGHGTNGDDLLGTNHRDWLRRGIDEYLDLAGRYRRVFVGGLSMGGLIAAAIAAQFQPAGLLLYAPAFTLFDWRVPLTPYLGLILSRIPRHHDLDHTDPDLRAIEDAYQRFDWVRPAGHLRRLQIYARRRLPLVTCPTLLVISPADRTVPSSVAGYITARIGGPVDILKLTTSGHVVTNDNEADRVAAESLAWINER